MYDILSPLFQTAPSADCGMSVRDSAEKLTFRSWMRIRTDAQVLATNLAARGIARGSNVALLVDDPAEAATLVQASWLCGSSFTMLHHPTPRVSVENWISDTRDVIRMLGSSALVVEEAFTSIGKYLENDVAIINVQSLREPVVGERVSRRNVEMDDVAVLQLTSGTTGTPKAVEITYANLEANHLGLTRALDMTSEDVMVSWLPLFHDMGMIGTLITAMLLNMNCALMSPADFIKNPLLWPTLITQFRGTISPAPNFAYSLLARRMKREPDDAPYDLSSLRLAINGAEAIEDDALIEFHKVAQRFGFRREAFRPAYGMAEATLAVSFTKKEEVYSVDIIDTESLEKDKKALRVAESSSGVSKLVKLGVPVPGMEVMVSSADHVELPADHVGELMIKGAAVTKRYLSAKGQEIATDDEGWLATGDLGYMTEGGEIVVCGRSKDVIIIAGKNISPQKIERAAEMASGVRAGNVAAVPFRASVREGIGILAESELADDAEKCEEMKQNITRLVNAAVGVPPVKVHILKKGCLPKTPSGKIQRRQAAALLSE